MANTQTVANLDEDPRTRRFPPGWDNKPQRNIEYSWTVSEADGHRITVELDCFHTRGRYVASINNVDHEVGAGVSTTMPLSAQRVLAESCARYSKPAFEAFAARALVDARTQAAEHLLDPFLRGERAPGR